MALILFPMSSPSACRGLWRATSPTKLRLTELIKDAFARHRHIGKEDQSLSPWEAFFAGGSISCLASVGLPLPSCSLSLPLRRLKTTSVTQVFHFGACKCRRPLPRSCSLHLLPSYPGQDTHGEHKRRQHQIQGVRNRDIVYAANLVSSPTVWLPSIEHRKVTLAGFRPA